MKIQDFGQILSGAAKHRYHDGDKTPLTIPTHNVGALPLKKSFPAPSYKRLIAKGVPPDIVAAVRALRDSLSFTNKGRRRRPDASQIVLHRDCAKEMLEGRLSISDMLARFDHPEGQRRKDLLEQIIAHHLECGHDLSFWRKNQRHGDNLQPGWRKLIVFKDRFIGKFFVGARIGRRVVRLKDFHSLADAYAACENQVEELQHLAQSYATIPALRGDDNRQRIGPAWRKRSVGTSPEEFSASLPFRGVQFGNHVEHLRRQQDLDDAFDACHDLAEILQIPSTAIPLGETLGLAFGARGHGGWRGYIAHFEPASVIINITKTKGAGSFAHEWWHALDNHIARLAGVPHGLATTMLGSRALRSARVKPLGKELETLVATIYKTSLPQRSWRLDCGKRKPYFGLIEEITARAFEAWVLHELKGRGQVNDWLVNILEWSQASPNGSVRGMGKNIRYPYPIADENLVIASAFEHFFRSGGPMNSYLRSLTCDLAAKAA